MMSMGSNVNGRATAKQERRNQQARRNERNALLAGFALRDENTATRQPWYLVGVVLLIMSAIFRQPLLLIAALLVFIIGSIPELWYRFGLTALAIERTLDTARAEVGAELTLTLRVENRKLLPLPRLELMDDLPRELVVVGTDTDPIYDSSRQVLANEMALLAFQRVVRRYRLRVLARGAYALGPMRVRAADPFGILVREQSYALPARLIVYPIVVPIERLGLPARALLGEQRVDRSLLRDPIRIAGVRPYHPGDDPRRLHWKATARTGALQTKVLELAAQRTVALVLDLRTQPSLVLGYDLDLAELLITTAASVAQWSFDQRCAVGLYSNGSLLQNDRGGGDQPSAQGTDGGKTPSAGGLQTEVRLRIPPSAHPAQPLRVLEGLARLQPIYTRPITAILAEEEARLPIGTTVVFCGAARTLTLDTLTALERLRARGHAVVLLVAGAEDIPHVSLPVYRVGTRETWGHLLDETLALRGVDRAGVAQEVPEPAPSPHLQAEAVQ